MKGRPKGSPKTPGSGRKKGTPNKDTARVLELCREKAGTTPAEVLAEALNDPENRLWAAEKLLPYCYAKPTADDSALIDEEPKAPLTQEQRLELIKGLRAPK